MGGLFVFCRLQRKRRLLSVLLDADRLTGSDPVVQGHGFGRHALGESLVNVVPRWSHLQGVELVEVLDQIFYADAVRGEHLRDVGLRPLGLAELAHGVNGNVILTPFTASSAI